MIKGHHDGPAFEDERKKSALAIVQNRLAQNDYEQRDKHLIAHLIPISLTMVQEESALGNERIEIDASP